MLRKLLIGIALIINLSAFTALAQNISPSPTVRPRTTATPNASKASTPQQKSTDVQQPSAGTPTARPAEAKPKIASSETPAPQSVVAAFNALVDGIRKANVNAVTNSYWKSPRLVLFNNNGTVTKGWEQMRRNRESSYKDVKDVKLDVRDVSITMLGRDAAVVSALWTQSQTFKGEPETASGRMTLVFRRVGKDWKAIHLHTSPDRPDPSRVLPSEAPASTPSPNP